MRILVRPLILCVNRQYIATVRRCVAQFLVVKPLTAFVEVVAVATDTWGNRTQTFNPRFARIYVEARVRCARLIIVLFAQSIARLPAYSAWSSP